jgi:hypothetical protein
MVKWMLNHPRCCVWAGVGTGKTSAVLSMLETLALVEDCYPALIIGTKRIAAEVWSNEIAKWDDFRNLKVSCVVGTPKERYLALKTKADIYTINYENIPWLHDALGNWPFKIIVADEASRLKNFRLQQGTKRSAILNKHAHDILRFIELTGTPSSKGLENLWGQLYFIDKGERLGKSFSAFKQRWFSIGYDGYSMTPLAHAEKEIYARIADVCLSIEVKDYYDLQEPLVNNIYVDLPPDARGLYDTMEKELFIQIEEAGIEAFNAASKSTKCLQLANGFCFTGVDKEWKEVHSAKLDALEDIVEEYNGNPIVVGYNFVPDKTRIMKRFPKAVDLSTTKGLKEFRTGHVAIGVAHPASLGHGVDGLQDVTSDIVFYSHGWDLELYDQLCGRIGPTRQMQSGNNKRVFIHHILARGTLDEAVLERRKSKRSVQDALLAAMRAKYLI